MGPRLQYAALEARLSAVQGELTSAYRDKSSLAEASLAATKQLQVVRDLNERQAAELDAAQAEVRALREAVAALTAEADHQRQAQALSGREMEVRVSVRGVRCGTRCFPPSGTAGASRSLPPPAGTPRGGGGGHTASRAAGERKHRPGDAAGGGEGAGD